jgi:hypothetical protein
LARQEGVAGEHRRAALGAVRKLDAASQNGRQACVSWRRARRAARGAAAHV